MSPHISHLHNMRLRIFDRMVRDVIPTVWEGNSWRECQLWHEAWQMNIMNVYLPLPLTVLVILIIGTHLNITFSLPLLLLLLISIKIFIWCCDKQVVNCPQEKLFSFGVNNFIVLHWTPLQLLVLVSRLYIYKYFSLVIVSSFTYSFLYRLLFMCIFYIWPHFMFSPF